MYETRHNIFKFTVVLNTALLALVFQFVAADVIKLIFSIVGMTVTISLTLMARRSLRYLSEIENYAKKLEGIIGFGLISETGARMPKGFDSSFYLFVVYWVISIMWEILTIYYISRVFGVDLP
jgi:hypothetical protein